MNILNVFVSLINQRKEIKRKHQERLISVYKEENQGVEPNVDCNGRFHAPIDGYVIPEIIARTFDLKGKEDVIWGKGEFLPVFLTPQEIDEITPYDPSLHHSYVKIKTTQSEYDEFVDNYNKNDDINSLVSDLKSGKEFMIDDVVYKYTYFKTPHFYAKKIKLEQEKFEDQKREQERKYKGKLLLTGEVEIVGDVIKTIIRTIDGVLERKCIIELENKATLYGTLPAKVNDDYKGRISFVAKVSISPKDDTHGFYSRPKKVLIL